MPTFTYDEDQVAEADQVKFHIGQVGTGVDADAAGRTVSDEEIAAVLSRVTVAGRGRAYKAAAEVMGAIRTQFLSVGKGEAERQVSKLRIIYSGRGDVQLFLQQREQELLREAARLSRSTPRVMRLVQSTGRHGRR